MSQHALLVTHSGKPSRFKAGRDHTINGERVHVIAVECVDLGQLTHDQAKALGHRRGTAPLKREWIKAKDDRWLKAEERTDSDILARFNTRWAQRPVWYVTYRKADSPRFLAAAGRGDVDNDEDSPTYGNADYTTNPARAIDDLEVIDTQTQERYSKDALAFCIGRQLARAKDEAAKRDTRARQFRQAA